MKSQIVKMMKCAIFTLVTMVLMPSCGMQRTMDTMQDSTNRMEGNVQYGNRLQEGLLEANLLLVELMKRSNSLQEALRELSAYMAKLTEEMAGLTKEMLETMKELAHLQKLGDALKNMFAPENTKSLLPPTGMIPWGKVYAEEARSEELTALSRLLMMDAEHSLNGPHAKLSYVIGMGVICGQVPQPMIDFIEKTEIVSPGFYEGTAYGMFMGRYTFLKEVMFLPIIEKEDYLNIVHLRKAVEYYNLLKWISTRPYAHKIKLTIYWVVDWKLDPREIVDLAADAKAQFKKKLDPAVYKSEEAQALLKQFN